MAITVIPRSKNWGDYLGEGFASGTQSALEMALKKKMMEEELKQKIAILNKQNEIERANQYAKQYATKQDLMTTIPDIFKNVYTYQGKPFTPGQSYQGKDISEFPKDVQSGLTKQSTLNLEEAQKYPGLDLESMGIPYKIPQRVPTLAEQMAEIEMYKKSLSGDSGQTTSDMGLTGVQIGGGKKQPSLTFEKPTARDELAKVETEERRNSLIAKSNLITQQAKDTLNSITKAKEGIDKGYFGIYGVVPAIPGTDKYTWQQNVDKLLAGKMIDLMTQMKEASKTGATGFGQLSEQEGQILRNASTALKRGLAPQEAKIILDEMETMLQKVVSPSQQGGIEDMSQYSDDELRRIIAGE